MVGVPGKYKGCETCRRRRVKVWTAACSRPRPTTDDPTRQCSNERPCCSNCANSGRQCEGYERERVFITGTPETKGRVASHPKKAGSTKRQKRKAREDAKPQLWPAQPLTSAWDDFLRLSSHGTESAVLLTALQTNLQAVFGGESGAVAGFDIALPTYAPSELQPHVGDDEFSARTICLAQLGGVAEAYGSTGGYCAFLFEHNSSAAPNPSVVAWEPTSEQTNLVKGLGPKHFTTFPNHQYFVRVHRPLAVSLALLSRRESFLSEQDWTSTPWERHPKSPLDELFDVVLCLPSILSTVDRILPLPVTITRRLKAQELLQRCLTLETRFHQWLGGVVIGAGDQHAPYWSDELGGPGGDIPFAKPYTFRDGLTGIMLLYYWMSQILFHRCIQSLHGAIFQPVLDAYPDMWPDLPPSLHIDPTQYQDGRELAANICRGLDAALNSTTQPDMLLAPMTVALDFYRDINAASQDGVLEILWLEAFKRRLAAKGQHIANVLQGQRWVEVARY
ncbi:D-lactate dehydrogenase, mitochondrial [Tolypocladium capitatum]|uniref:D-lactate dehydrogenase, mitochondrial n=1 Tax=Tolypocladium capitatum TaxID=45235 RepID=A0A2K3QL39_9HYPO|nr:D-lactate dehydrogenase, mitochondrial [Tolypocladium capitatum]